MSFLQIPHPQEARRLFLGRSGLVLSGAAVALLAGRDALAAKMTAVAHKIRRFSTRPWVQSSRPLRPTSWGPRAGYCSVRRWTSP